MQISFNTENFKNRPQSLISVLSHLNYTSAYSPPAHEDIESIVCRTPSLAYKYTKYVAKKGISASAESVFLKNPNIGIRYLRYINRDSFLDSNIQKRFYKKITKNPTLAFEFCRSLSKRLSEDEEEVFLKCMPSMRSYALYVIRGPFPEKIHNMLVLKSYEEMSSFAKNQLKEYLKFSQSKNVHY